MTTQTNEPAATPAGAERTTDDNGIMDMDALAPSTEEASDIEDGELKTEAEPETKPAETPAEDEATAEARRRPTTPQRTKLREQRLLDEIAARDREIETLRGKTAAPAAKAGDGPQPPKEEDFNGDFLAFSEARAAFRAEQAALKAVDDKFKSREDADNASRAQEAARVRALDHAERVEAAKEVITDFDTVMEGMKDVNVRDDLIQEIMSSKNSAVIAYHLAKNPSELEALNRMPPRELARAMGRLEATLKLPEPKKTTSAPPPLSRPSGGTTPPSQERILAGYLDKKYGKDRK